MDKYEFLLLIPAILYGHGLTDLLKIFNKKKMYWEIIAWGFTMFLSLIVLWFGLFDDFSIFSDNMLIYTFFMIAPMIYSRACNVLTPEEHHSDTKKYWLENSRMFFILMFSLIIFFQIIGSFIDTDILWLKRILYSISFLLPVIYNNIYTRTITLITTLTLIILTIIGIVQ